MYNISYSHIIRKNVPPNHGHDPFHPIHSSHLHMKCVILFRKRVFHMISRLRDVQVQQNVEAYTMHLLKIHNSLYVNVVPHTK